MGSIARANRTLDALSLEAQSVLSVEHTWSQSPDTDFVAAGECTAALGRSNLEYVLVL